MLNLDRIFSRFKNVDIYFADSLCGKSTARRNVHDMVKGTPRSMRPLIVDTDALHLKGHSGALLALLRVYAADNAHVIVLTNDVDFMFAAVRGGARVRSLVFFSPTMEGIHTFFEQWKLDRGEVPTRSLARMTAIAMRIAEIDEMFDLPVNPLIGLQIVTPQNLTLARSLIQNSLRTLVHNYIFERSNHG